MKVECVIKFNSFRRSAALSRESLNAPIIFNDHIPPNGIQSTEWQRIFGGRIIEYYSTSERVRHVCLKWNLHFSPLVISNRLQCLVAFEKERDL